MLICRQHACDFQQSVMLGLEICRNVSSFSGKPATKLCSENIPDGSALTAQLMLGYMYSRSQLGINIGQTTGNVMMAGTRLTSCKPYQAY